MLLKFRSRPSEARPAQADSNPVVVRPDLYIVRSLLRSAGLSGVLRAAHERLNPPRPGEELLLSTVASYGSGQVFEMATVLKIPNLAGSTPQILPDRSLPISSLRGRDALLFGEPIR